MNRGIEPEMRLVVGHQRTELYHGDKMVGLWNRSLSAEEVEEHWRAWSDAAKCGAELIFEANKTC